MSGKFLGKNSDSTPILNPSEQQNSVLDQATTAPAVATAPERTAPAVIPCRDPNDAPGIITDNLGTTYLCTPRTIDP
ncbi:hypothetical protein, partial [Rothia nasimurium]|uniref:hypothetical protein n=1 Tax=Rothia nasimurium TaxID=85336 RepID=UPI00117A488D